MAVLEIINLSSGYKSLLFNNLSFKIRQPGLFTILGKNGSGKTTLLKCIAQQQEYKGSILWNDRNLHDLSIADRAGTISYLNQRNSISLNLKVNELVVMGRYRFKSVFANYNKDDFKKVDEWLERLGIESYRNAYIQELSGGEQQLVWICQAFIQDTPIIILDEPSSQLDLHNKRKVFNLISAQSSESKMIILVTHDIEYLKGLNGNLINLSDSANDFRQISHQEIDAQRALLESD